MLSVDLAFCESYAYCYKTRYRKLTEQQIIILFVNRQSICHVINLTICKRQISALRNIFFYRIIMQYCGSAKLIGYRMTETVTRRFAPKPFPPGRFAPGRFASKIESGHFAPRPWLFRPHYINAYTCISCALMGFIAFWTFEINFPTYLLIKC